MNNERSLAKEITEGFEALKSMRNNEPVAWMLVDASWNDFCRYSSYPSDGAIPLYTHPVKELSETRIKQIFVEQTGFYFDHNPADDLALMDFAKALLLEAQEK